MGDLYFAYDQETQRRRHIKIACDPTGETLARFSREMYTLKTVQHENIVNPLDYGEHEGRPFYVLEAIEAERLDFALLSSKLVPIGIVFEIVSQLVGVVAEAMDTRSCIAR